MAQGKFTKSPTPSNIVSAVNAMVDDIAGKAASSHNHSASNITSGTLAVARGGTGATTAANARTNLGLATVASTGSYNDLSNKPTIPSAYKHPDSGVTAGTYRSVTVNAQGHVTGGSNPTLAIADGGTGATTASNACANIGALPTSGGTMTGAIKRNGNVIENLETNGSVNICGGTSLDDGAYLILRGKDQPDLSGRFELYTKTDEYKSYLVGFPSGELLWGGDGIVRTITTVQTDSNGDNFAQLKADSEGGNLRLQKSNGVGLEFDTCTMNGSTGSARIYFNKPGEEAWRGFYFYETGEINDGNGYMCDSVVAQGTNYIKYRSGLSICWGKLAIYTDGLQYYDVTLPIPINNGASLATVRNGNTNISTSTSNDKILCSQAELISNTVLRVTQNSGDRNPFLVCYFCIGMG